MNKKQFSLFQILLLLCWQNLAHALDLVDKIRQEEKYAKLTFVGRGSYGAVFRYRHHVVKVSPIKDSDSTIMNILEAALLQSLSHEAIPRPLAVRFHRGQYRKYLEIHLPYYDKPRADPAFVMRQMSSLLSYLDNLNMAHRDIKFSHILACGDLIKLIDWGCSDIFTTCPMNWCGTTLNYRSPESLLGYLEYPKENDMWSFGVSTLEIGRNGALTFTGGNERAVYSEAYDLTHPTQQPPSSEESATIFVPQKVAEIPGISLQHKDLLRRSLVMEWEKRITASELAANLEIPIAFSPLPPAPKSIPSSSPITPAMRRIIYSWLQFIATQEQLHDKVLFEAMSIADRFIESSTIKSRYLQLAGMVALYLAAGFYDIPFEIRTLLVYGEYQYSREDFNRWMLRLLASSKFQIIFNHTLRAYQKELYENFTSANRDIAVTLLTLLEIDGATFAYSNERKWQLVNIVLAEKCDRETQADVEAMNQLLKRFRYEKIANTIGYGLLRDRLTRIQCVDETLVTL